MISRLPLNLVICSLFTAAIAWGQVTPAEPVGTEPSISVVSPNDAVQPPANDAEIAVDPANLLPDLPQLPASKPTLVGGTIEKLDRVQDQLTVHVFGGDKMKILFDARTRIYRDGASVSVADLRQGDRVYVDTILNGDTIFARNIHLHNTAPVGETQGVIVAFQRDKGDLIVRDAISPQPLKVRVTGSTRVIQGDRMLAASSLTPGTLVAIKFGTSQKEAATAREVSVLAARGASFTFAGQVTFLDLHAGLLVLTSATDHKTYEIRLDPSQVRIDDNLRRGADVSVLTRFDGTGYIARRIELTSRNLQ
jgi:hypothetical protein